jgi:hypothetical protein
MVYCQASEVDGLVEVGFFNRGDNSDQCLSNIVKVEVRDRPAFATTVPGMSWTYRSLTQAGFRQAASWINPNTHCRVTLWWRDAAKSFRFRYTPDDDCSNYCCGLYINSEGNDGNGLIPGLFIEAEPKLDCWYSVVPIQVIGKHRVFVASSERKIRKLS